MMNQLIELKENELIELKENELIETEGGMTFAYRVGQGIRYLCYANSLMGYEYAYYACYP